MNGSVCSPQNGECEVETLKRAMGLQNGHPLTTGLEDQGDGQSFLKEAFNVILEEVLRRGTNVQEKVCEWQDPAELSALLDLELREGGENQQQLLKRVQDVARYSVKTCHPYFFNQLFSGMDYHSLAGRFLTESLNTSQYTYEVGPVFVLMENEVLSKLRLMVGWPDGDGIFCPGGSMSNMYAMNVARYRAFPQVKVQGMWALPRLAIFTSQESHYSVCKAASFQGIGLENIFTVKVDERGCMIPEDLEDKIELARSQDSVPLLVSATSGTTIQGAFDPLDRIADICARNSLWLHVDAAWGGSVLFSSAHKHLLKGIERADSVAWNPHKMLMAGLQCSVFLMKDTTDLLKRCHCANATYLFQQDKFYDVSLDTGDKSIQCGRKVDCLKLWLMWKAVGSRGLGQRVDKAFENTRYLVGKMKMREGFQLVNEPQFVNVCFWFIPPSLRGSEGTEEYQEKLSKVAPIIKERMVRKGCMMVGYQPQKGRVNFFRMVIISPQITRKDLDFFLDEIERLGNDL
ncbi:cysteine sulfinic acid decarboxylase [Brienomyrus brachyistius]|uniref:cysteine sulfinic acid decarboxylase n=1 Tax=Brienomyrus brachyistius TaxID=42636 RepID=UPI0020B1B390|nr:cysteine sulfinic acid decarboxylase [Brienomyrus brachyistius]XP_048839886.1 cysteine sulfinic acid decarboxylase [Brienomyrus brachyistius]XP_048839887.1 cysteine sulfinic acid decarboxylase [Brienomyrus brachyistius]